MRKSSLLGSRERCLLILCLLAAGSALSAAVLVAQPAPPLGVPPSRPPPRPYAVSAVESVTAGIRKALQRPEPGDTAGARPAPDADGTATAAPEAAAADSGDGSRSAAPKKMGKSVTPAKATGKGRVKALEDKAQQCREAHEALQLYKDFLAAPDTTPEENEQAQARLEFWEQAARDRLIRVGKKWMSPKEAEKLKQEADKLVAEALELINVESFSKADAKLERASKIYPDHLESLFLLGVGAYLTDDPRGAEKRFEQCLSRAPTNVPLLNNVAVCEVLTKHFDQAVKHWEKAASLEPANSVIVQNLGRFIADASNRNKPSGASRSKIGGKSVTDIGVVDKRVLDDATALYTKLVAGGKAGRYDARTGYIIIKLFGTRPGEKTTPEESQVVGNGSGFVVWEGYVLTNYHVVEGVDSVVLQDPGNPGGEPLPGKVAATSPPLDLAIVQCNALLAEPAPLNEAAPARGMEVLALGFPVMNVVGKGLKATRGIVTGLPSNDTGNLMVLDVQVNPGNSGGPLCDKSGRVMGVVAAKTFTERFVQGYGLAIPMQNALPFIKQHVPGFSYLESPDEKLEWTDVDARVSKSTVLVLIRKKRAKK
jgi:S1-C subfamily serine protease